MNVAPPRVRYLGRAAYAPTLAAMQRFVHKRPADAHDEIWLLEHEPVFTLGQNADRAHVLAAGDIPVVPVDRGGQVTYHGPGQLVVYPMVYLPRLKLGVRSLVEALEGTVVDWLATLGHTAHARRSAPGVYVNDAKLASVGLRVRRHWSYHGMAVNIALDLEPFARINPCGHAGLAMTQVAALGGPQRVDVAARALLPILLARLGYPAQAAPTLLTELDAMEHKSMTEQRRPRIEPGRKMTAEEKMARIPVKIQPTEKVARKPDWIRVKAPTTAAVAKLKKTLRENRLHTVCEEASCPNLTECFGKGTATFMIMGDICTRRCSFCDVAHGRPKALDGDEPANLAHTVAAMGLRYVVITSVDRDDLRDGGAGHFVDCIRAIRGTSPNTRIEVLVPDFRGRLDRALQIMAAAPPDVFNHNVETVPRLYKAARPGSSYEHSMALLKAFKAAHPNVPTKSGLMVGIGETADEIRGVMADLRAHDCDMITIGQYLQPSRFHLPVERYVHPDEFRSFEKLGYELGFAHVASGPLVRSSYHADVQAEGLTGTS